MRLQHARTRAVPKSRRRTNLPGNLRIPETGVDRSALRWQSFQTLGGACRMSRLLQHLSQIASRRAPVEHARVSARLPCGIAPTEDIAHRTIRCGRWLRVDASRSAENRHGQVAIDFVSPLRLRGYGRRSALHRMREGDSAAEVGNIQGRAGPRAFSVCLRRHVLGHLRIRRCERNRRSLAIERARSGLR